MLSRATRSVPRAASAAKKNLAQRAFGTWASNNRWNGPGNAYTTTPRGTSPPTTAVPAGMGMGMGGIPGAGPMPWLPPGTFPINPYNSTANTANANPAVWSAEQQRAAMRWAQDPNNFIAGGYSGYSGNPMSEPVLTPWQQWLEWQQWQQQQQQPQQPWSWSWPQPGTPSWWQWQQQQTQPSWQPTNVVPRGEWVDGKPVALPWSVPTTPWTPTPTMPWTPTPMPWPSTSQSMQPTQPWWGNWWNKATPQPSWGWSKWEGRDSWDVNDWKNWDMSKWNGPNVLPSFIGAPVDGAGPWNGNAWNSNSNAGNVPHNWYNKWNAMWNMSNTGGGNRPWPEPQPNPHAPIAPFVGNPNVNAPNPIVPVPPMNNPPPFVGHNTNNTNSNWNNNVPNPSASASTPFTWPMDGGNMVSGGGGSECGGSALASGGGAMGFPNPNALSLPLMAQPTDPASWWMWQHPMPTGLDEVVTDIMSGNKKFDFLLMSRCGITWLLMCAKKEKGLTFVDIAKKVHRSEVWTTAAMFGQHSMTADEANNLLNALGFNPKEHKLGARIASILQCPPMRGSALILPHDPTIYRFYELVQVYGPTLKALIAEKFGDGIMSAVDLKMYVEKEQDSGPWPPGPGGVVGALPDGAFGPEWRGLQQLQQQHAGATGSGVPLTPPNGPNTGAGMWSNGKERVKITISGAFLPYRKW